MKNNNKNRKHDSLPTVDVFNVCVCVCVSQLHFDLSHTFCVAF